MAIHLHPKKLRQSLHDHNHINVLLGISSYAVTFQCTPNVPPFSGSNWSLSDCQIPHDVILSSASFLSNFSGTEITIHLIVRLFKVRFGITFVSNFFAPLGNLLQEHNIFISIGYRFVKWNKHKVLLCHCSIFKIFSRWWWFCILNHRTYQGLVVRYSLSFIVRIIHAHVRL